MRVALAFLAALLIAGPVAAQTYGVTPPPGVTSTSCSNGIACSPTTGAVVIQQDGTLPTLSGNNNFTGQETLSNSPGANQSALSITGAIPTGAGSQPLLLYTQPGASGASFNTGGTALGFAFSGSQPNTAIGIWNNGTEAFYVTGNGTLTANGIASYGTIGLGLTKCYLFSLSANSFQLCNYDAATPSAVTIQAQSVSAGTSNTAGVNATIAGSKSTGLGTSGSLVLATGSSVSDAGTAHTITAFSGSASPYTITATGTTAYPVGGIVTIAGASPSSLNGSYTVTASSAGSFTATTTQTGTWTSGGTATYSATQQNPAVTALSIAGAAGSTPGAVSIPNPVMPIFGTCTNLSGSRSLNTSYTNNTGKSMFVEATTYGTAGGGSAFQSPAGGFNTSYFSYTATGTSDDVTVSGFVAPGATYEVTGGTQNGWAECQ